MGRRRRAEAVCPRWRSVSCNSAELWDEVSWVGGTDADEQAASLRSFLAWQRSRTLAPRCLRLHLRANRPQWPLAAMQHSWLQLGALLAHCAPRLQALAIKQEHPDASRLDAVTPAIGAACLPGIGTWLLPCTQLRSLDVEAPWPIVVLHQGVPHNLPALQRLSLRSNMSK